jgi:hypothetical protein
MHALAVGDKYKMWALHLTVLLPYSSYLAIREPKDMTLLLSFSRAQICLHEQVSPPTTRGS